MRTLLVSFLGLTMTLGAFAAERPPERDMIINIHEVLVPPGFDSDSEVYVVASGVFPNSCYRWKEARVQHNRPDGIHLVQAVARVSQGMCLMVLVPYSKEINLGRLGRGDHRVRFMNGDGTYLEKEIKIQ